MSKNLLIIFVKNQIPGKVKTRLASTIGHPKALEIYQQLLVITENATQKVKADKQVYFSQEVIEQEWKGCLKFVQKGDNLGEKMQNAFKNGFSMHYDKIILIGSDLPDISSEIHERQ